MIHGLVTRTRNVLFRATPAQHEPAARARQRKATARRCATLLLAWMCVVSPARFVAAGCEDGDYGETRRGNILMYDIAGSVVRATFACGTEPCRCGKYADESLWIAPARDGGNITFESASPDQTGNGPTLRNGMSVNAKSETAQGWYGGLAYSDALNVKLPVTYTSRELSSPQVHLKSVARRDALGVTRKRLCVSDKVRQCLELVVPITVVASPPGNVFRPGFWGSDYKEHFPASDFDPNAWPSMPASVQAISWQTAYETVRLPNPSVFVSPNIVQNFHPRVNTQVKQGYGGKVTQQLTSALIRSIQAPKSKQEAELKQRMLRGLAQRHIDLRSIIKGGVRFGKNPRCGPFFAAGGHHTGKWMEYMAGAALLGRSEKLAAELDELFRTPLGRQCFSESGYVQPYDPAVGGKPVPLFGHVSTRVHPIKIGARARRGSKTAADPAHRIDGGGNANSKCPPSYMAQNFEHWRGALAWMQTVPAIRAHMPKHMLEWVEITRRIHDVGAYCDPDSYASTGPRSLDQRSYRARGALEAFRAYRDIGVFAGMEGSEARPER